MARATEASPPSVLMRSGHGGRDRSRTKAVRDAGVLSPSPCVVAPPLVIRATATDGNADGTFVLGADDIRTLKQRIDGLAPPSKPVSTFVALSALRWTAFMRAKGLAAGEDTHLRGRLRPAVSAGYIGNCVRGCVVRADAGELVGDAGFLHAARAIQATVGEVVAVPLAGIGTWIQRVMALPAGRVANVGGSPMFRMHQLAGFGFGVPEKVVPVYMPGSPKTTTTMCPWVMAAG